MVLVGIFSQNISWNRYETALLVDAYHRIKMGEVKKRDAVISLSQRLRNRMLLNGIEINDKYRNESGIVLQMSAIEYCFTDGVHGLKPSNALFPEVCSTYLVNRREFNEMLAKAERMYPMPASSRVISQVQQSPDKPSEPNPSPQPMTQQPQQHPAHHSSYGEFPHQSTSLASEPIVRNVSAAELEQIKDVLSHYFPKGFRLDSTIEIKKFQRFFNEKFNRNCTLSSEALTKKIKKCGIEISGKVFVPEHIISIILRDEIKDYIEKEFSQNKPCVFYEVLYKVFKDKLLDTLIADEESLKVCLQFFFGKKWHFGDKSISLTRRVKLDINQEVLNYVQEQGHVMTEDEVVSGLGYLPADEVREAFRSNKDKLISCGRNTRFHIRLFVISSAELKEIKSLISKAIKDYDLITDTELLSDIQKNLPSLLANNTSIPEIGIRNAIANKLGHLFSFAGPIISSKSDSFTAGDALLSFARKKKVFTIDEIDSMAKSLNVPITPYLEQLLDFSIRINHDEFVPRDNVYFNVLSVDKAISALVGERGYLPLKAISNFANFPNGTYPWNSRLLESYLLTESSRYTLVFNAFLTKNNISGVIVEKYNPKLGSFEDAVSMALADSGIKLEKETAINYLVNEGYIARRRYADINTVLTRAKVIRNQ